MSDDIHETAALWLQAQADDDMDWGAFTAWLEADPRHRAAFDDIALLDEAIDRVRPQLSAPAAANDRSVMPRRRYYLVGGVGAVVAALLAVAVGSQSWQSGRPVAPTSYAAAAGETREVALAAGVHASLAAGSKLTVAANTPNALSLDGTAWFDVRHDPSRPLTVTAGGYEIRDVGTKFEVTSDGTAIRVAVAEGSVSVRAPGSAQAVPIRAGQAVTADTAKGALVVSDIPVSGIGGWRTGRFVYDQMPLPLVAADIARFTGKPVLVDDAIARRRFSGVLAPGDRDSMVASLQQLAGLRVRKEGNAVRLGGSAGN